ncbi:MAG: hypothetical protein LH477_17660 [Nocardioides sp.]|nr:hypothetical protein [Nocardioides sp.]
MPPPPQTSLERFATDSSISQEDLAIRVTVRRFESVLTGESWSEVYRLVVGQALTGRGALR